MRATGVSCFVGFGSLLLLTASSTPIHGDEVVTTLLGADETRVDVLTPVQTESGEWITETNGYVQLATGQNYWDSATRSWLPSSEAIGLGKGGAVALQGQQKAYFAPTLDDPRGTMQLRTPQEAWVTRWNLADPHTTNRVVGMKADFAGSLLIAGDLTETNGTTRYFLLKYQSRGELIWATNYASFDSPPNPLAAFDVDSDGNTVLTGTPDTVRFSSGGTVAWQRDFEDGDRKRLGRYARAMALDGRGTVLVTGMLTGATTGGDVATLGYDTETGNLLWVRRYNGAANKEDKGRAPTPVPRSRRRAGRYRDIRGSDRLVRAGHRYHRPRRSGALHGHQCLHPPPALLPPEAPVSGDGAGEGVSSELLGGPPLRWRTASPPPRPGRP